MKIKKLLAVILCSILTTVFTGGIVTAKTTDENYFEIPVSSTEALTYTGSWGEMTWYLDSETGVLNITGSGACLGSYSSYGSAPWHSYWKEIKIIVIGDEIESLGEFAFADCTYVTTVLMGANVSNIYDCAFSNCDRIENVYYKGTQKQWNSISVSDSGNNCLLNAAIHYNSTFAFENEPIYTNTVGYDWSWSFDETSKTLTISGNGLMSNWAMWGNVEWSHLGSDIETVVIEDGVINIGSYAFSGCLQLKKIYIPQSVTQINGYAFCSSSMDVYYEGNEAQWNEITITDETISRANIHYNNSTFSADTIAVTIDGAALTFDANPYITNGRTMVPMRAIFEALGCEVTWNNDEKSVTAVSENTTVKLTIGEAMMYVNNIAVSLDQAAEITSDRTFVPVRAVSEALGCEVNWNNETRTVEISTAAQSSETDYVWRMTAMLCTNDNGQDYCSKYVELFNYNTQGDVVSVSYESDSAYGEDYENISSRDVDYYLQNGAAKKADITTNEQGLVSSMYRYDDNGNVIDDKYFEYDELGRVNLVGSYDDMLNFYWTYECIYIDEMDLLIYMCTDTEASCGEMDFYKIYYDENGNPSKAVYAGEGYTWKSVGGYSEPISLDESIAEYYIEPNDESAAIYYTFKYEKIYLS